MSTDAILLLFTCLGLGGAGGAVYTVLAAPFSPRPARLRALTYVSFGAMVATVCAAVVAITVQALT
jgi:hypothetical protein